MEDDVSVSERSSRTRSLDSHTPEAAWPFWLVSALTALRFSLRMAIAAGKAAMSWKICIASLIASGALALTTRGGPPQTQPAAGAVKVTVTQVDDDRSLVHVPLSDQIRGGLSPDLRVDLMLKGEGVRNASR